MTNSVGYDKKLFILPFDQRSSFMKLFGWSGSANTDQTKIISEAKEIVYEGFLQALDLGVPREESAILCDEQFCSKVLQDAHENGHTFLLATEKSGQEEFDFEYGDDFFAHIEKFQPTFVKTLIRYNPEGDDELNKRQIAKLKKISDTVRAKGYKFLIEPLIPATAKQLEYVASDQTRYDLEIRPALAKEMMRQIQSQDVVVDVWKIEGMEQSEHYEAVVEQARTQGAGAGVIVLGRHAPDAQVEKWLNAGKKVDGVIGFAIGRTIFWDPLMQYREGKISRKDAAQKIAEKYFHFYKVFNR